MRRFDFCKWKEKHPRLFSRKSAVICGILFSVLLTLGSLWYAFWRTEKPLFANTCQYAMLYDASEDVTWVYRGKKNLGAFSGSAKERTSSFGGSVEVVLSDEGELFFVQKRTLEKISDQVSDYLLSVYGDAVLYLDLNGTLTRYCFTDEKSEVVAESYSEADLSCVVLSPRAQSVVYGIETEKKPSLWLWQSGGGKCLVSAPLAGDACPLGVSDDGRQIYYVTDGAEVLYLLQNEQQASLISSSFSSEQAKAKFNSVFSQILFSEQNGCTYHYEIGRGKEKISNGIACPVLQAKDGSRVLNENKSEMLSLSTFRDTLYSVKWQDVESLWYLDRNFYATEYTSEVSEVYWSGDAENLYFSRRSGEWHRLYRLQVEEGVARESLIASGVLSYAVTSDAETLYYVTRGDKLFKRSNETDTLIAEGVSEVYLSASDVLYFQKKASGFIAEPLYILKGENPVCVCEDVAQLVFTKHGVYAKCVSDGGEAWKWSSARRFKELQA